MEQQKSLYIEVFISDDPCCDETVAMIRRLADSRSEINVQDIKKADVVERAQALGIRSLPAIVINGKLVSCYAGNGQGEVLVQQAGMGQPYILETVDGVSAAQKFGHPNARAGIPLVEIRKASAFSHAEWNQLTRLVQAANIEPLTYRWAIRQWHTVVWMNGQIVSHVGLVATSIVVNGRCVKAGWITGVASQKDWQHRGYASAAMNYTTAFMSERLGAEMGWLICREQVVPFYSRLGWQVVSMPRGVTAQSDEFSSGDRLMVRSLSEADLSHAMIDLRGRSLKRRVSLTRWLLSLRLRTFSFL